MHNTFERILTFVLFVCMLSGIHVVAQVRTLHGHVIDATFDEPLIGVTVRIDGTGNGVITDFDGNFIITAKNGDYVTMSYVGYKDIRFKVTPSVSLLFTMEQKSELINEVVVVGYGQQKKESVVGAITQTDGDELLKSGNVNSVSEALQGQMPGVTAISTSSKPGADQAQLLIRGKASWNSTAPLFLVDGVERNFNDVDVNEIDKVSVLKDASATAVYGVKGANGVILITTKRGGDKKAVINFSMNLGLKAPTAEFNWLKYNKTQRLYNEAAANDLLWDKTIPESTINAWDNAYQTGNVGPYSDYFPDINWYDTMTKDYGTSQKYNVNVQGGSKTLSYFLSMGYLNDGDIYDLHKQDDFDPRYYYKRYNWRSNFDFKLSKSTTVSVNIAGNMGYRNQPAYRMDSYSDNPLIVAQSNVFPIKYSDGKWGSDMLGGGNMDMKMNQLGQRQYKTFQGFYDFILDQKLNFITKGLSAKAKVSYTTSSSRSSSIVKSRVYNAADSEAEKNYQVRYYRTYDYTQPQVAEDGSISYPLLSESRLPNDQIEEDWPVGASYDNFSDYSRRLYYEASLNYNHHFGSHNVTGLLLFKREQVDANTDTDKVMQFTRYSEDWVGRVTYNWKERYLAEFNGAYTGSEKFAPNKRFGFFPSYSVGWRVTEEPWIKPYVKGWLSNMKIRYSYGKVGSDIGAPRFNYVTQFNSDGNVKFGRDQSVSYGPLYSESKLGYLNATWETAIKQNLGIEMTFIDHLYLTLDLFREKREDILMTRNTISPWMGVNLPSVNIGKTKNHGLEMVLTWQDRLSSGLGYHMTANFSASENRIVFKDDSKKLPDYMKLAGKAIGYQNRYLVTGNYGTMDDIFNGPMSNINGVSQNKLVPGDFAYVDYNGDGVISGLDNVVVNHVDYPTKTIGLNLGANYKGFAVSAMFYAALNVWKSDLSLYTWDFPLKTVKAQPDALDRWTPADADKTDIVRPSVHLDNTYNSLSSTYTYKNYSFLRLKNVEISYQFPKNWIKGLSLSRLQLYVNGTNLWTLTSVDDRRDPETSGANVYPIVKRYNFGARLTF
ncbi:MAG: TonB-dependent receptor [Bacteroidaceae bacterium]